MSHQYISWTASPEKLLVCMIITGCHVNIKHYKQPQMERICEQFYATLPYLQDIYHKDEGKGVRRLKEKYSTEYKS